MRLDKITAKLRGLERDPTDRALLAEICSDVGDELPRHRWDVLREFRAEAGGLCSRLQDDAQGDFVRGALVALGRVLAACEAYVRDERLRAEVSGLAKAHWLVLDRIRTSHRCRPKDIAAALACDKSHVTRILNALRIAGLVEDCEPPTDAQATDRRERWHRLTSEGIAALSENRPSARDQTQPPDPVDEAPASEAYPMGTEGVTIGRKIEVILQKNPAARNGDVTLASCYWIEYDGIDWKAPIWRSVTNMRPLELARRPVPAQRPELGPDG